MTKIFDFLHIRKFRFSSLKKDLLVIKLNKWRSKRDCTWKIPWVIFVDVELSDELNGEWAMLNLPS